MGDAKRGDLGDAGAADREGVIQLADWWRATVTMERELDYRASSPLAQAAWDDLVGRLMLAPSPLLYLELMECARLWKQQPGGSTLLDALVATACGQSLWLAEHAQAAAVSLRQHLLRAIGEVDDLDGAQRRLNDHESIKLPGPGTAAPEPERQQLPYPRHT